MILVLALFLFSERVSGSARVAGIATLLYMANPNFIFWSAQFSYESMALPLAVLVIYAATRRTEAIRADRHFGFTLTALLSIGAVVITHHLTSYLLVTFLVLWALIVRFRVHLLFIDGVRALIRRFFTRSSNACPHLPDTGLVGQGQALTLMPTIHRGPVDWRCSRFSSQQRGSFLSLARPQVISCL